MALPKWAGVPLHALGGAAITAAGVLLGIPGWLVLLVVSLGGWLREVVQHDLRLTPHQALEAAAWAMGGAISWSVVVWVI